MFLLAPYPLIKRVCCFSNHHLFLGGREDQRRSGFVCNLHFLLDVYWLLSKKEELGVRARILSQHMVRWFFNFINNLYPQFFLTFRVNYCICLLPFECAYFSLPRSFPSGQSEIIVRISSSNEGSLIQPLSFIQSSVLRFIDYRNLIFFIVMSLHFAHNFFQHRR